MWHAARRARVRGGDGADAERVTEGWTREIEWSFTPLDKPTPDFQLKLAPKFTAPRTSTHGDEVVVEGWRPADAGSTCYRHSRRVHNARKAEWHEDQDTMFCIEDGNVLLRQDGHLFRNGKPDR